MDDVRKTHLASRLSLSRQKPHSVQSRVDRSPKYNIRCGVLFGSVYGATAHSTSLLSSYGLYIFAHHHRRTHDPLMRLDIAYILCLAGIRTFARCVRYRCSHRTLAGYFTSPAPDLEDPHECGPLWKCDLQNMFIQALRRTRPNPQSGFHIPSTSRRRGTNAGTRL